MANNPYAVDCIMAFVSSILSKQYFISFIAPPCISYTLSLPPQISFSAFEFSYQLSVLSCLSAFLNGLYGILLNIQ